MRLQQNQVWRVGDRFLRIVTLERLAVDYKDMPEAITLEGTHHHVRKKEFCRMIKGGTLLPMAPHPDTP